MISSYNILVPINSLDTMPFVGLFLSISEKKPLVTLAVNINSYLRETVFGKPKTIKKYRHTSLIAYLSFVMWQLINY